MACIVRNALFTAAVSAGLVLGSCSDSKGIEAGSDDAGYGDPGDAAMPADDAGSGASDGGGSADAGGEPSDPGPQGFQAYLKSSRTTAEGSFGESVAIRGHTAVVGEPGNGPGVAHVFVRRNGQWTHSAVLEPSNGEEDDDFGSSVAIDGDTVVVGAHWEDGGDGPVNGDASDNSVDGAGAAYVFVRDGSSWSQQAYLKSPDPGDLYRFGWDVDVSRNTVVVTELDDESGDPDDPTDESVPSSGAVHVFVRDEDDSWSRQAYLKAAHPDTGDDFGASAAVHGNTIVVGAPGESSAAGGIDGDQTNNERDEAGAAYVFGRHDSTWSSQAYLKAPEPRPGDAFGKNVDVDGDTVVVTAQGESSEGHGAGAGYVFVREGGSWGQQAHLKASNASRDDSFGSAVALSGDRIVVGAYGESNESTGLNGNQNQGGDSFLVGAAYAFQRSGTTWTQTDYIKATNAGHHDSFGWSSGVSADTVIVGAPEEASRATGVNGNQNDDLAADSGAAYVYRL